MVSAPTPRPMTLTQKILASHARNLPRPWVQAGDVLQISVDWTIASELAWNGMERTYSMLGRPKLHDKDRFFLAVDHTVDPVTLANDKRAQKLVQLSRTFAKESGIRHFYDANQTILHTRFYRDLVRPGDLVLGADSHTSSHGGLGAVSIGLGGADGVPAAWLAGRADEDDPLPVQPMRAFRADADAPYARKFQVDLARLEPQVAVPFSPDNVKGVTDLAGTELQGLFIGACTTTEEELVLGALVLDAAGVSRPANDKQIVVPGDLAIQENLRRAGLWTAYERAGFRIDPPGCSMCLAVASRKAGRGEKWLSSQNRNFENRMGDGSLAHLGSAATVAASAQTMKITDPRSLLARVDEEKFRRILGERRPRRAPEVRMVEPEIHLAPAGAIPSSAKEARAADRRQAGTIPSRIQRFGDNVATDAIIPGQFCHLTSLSELGAKAFHFVRPDFVQKVRAGAQVVVAGEGWGSGSSREQAVLALKGAGIQAIVAKSYAFIHKRNLVNEARPFLVVQDARFYELAKEGEEIEVDLAAGIVRVAGQEFAAEEPSRIIQALVGEGGIVPAIQHHGTTVFETLTG